MIEGNRAGGSPGESGGYSGWVVAVLLALVLVLACCLFMPRARYRVKVGGPVQHQRN